MLGPAASKHHFLYACLDCQPILARQPELRDAWPGGEHLDLRAAEAITEPFRQLIGEVTRQSAFRAGAIRLAVDALVLQIARLLSDKPSESLQALHPAVWQVKELIDTQPAQPWTLADWARLTGVSANHLAGLFAEQVGTPPHRYLLQRRIESACRLLRDSDLPITQIALECGFSSSQHLAGRFGRHMGATPSAYRKAHRRAAQ
jgi:AraC-like DNA-binding protein